MATYIRLTDYKNSEEKEKGFFEEKNRFIAKQEDFFKIPGSPIAYWVSDRVKEIFEKSEKLGEVAEAKKGLSTGKDALFIRNWWEVNFNLKSIKWFPLNKGGEYKKWYGNNLYLIDWENNGKKLKEFKGSVIRNESYYFKNSITWTMVGELFAARTNGKGYIFEGAGPSLFVKEDYIQYFLQILAFFNSKLGTFFIKILNPTNNKNINDILRFPLFTNFNKQKIDQLTQENIDISKEEWDSRETSWDFTRNELIKHKIDSKIETAYKNYCEYWKEKFYKLHENEEELNRLFIEIYGLEDEITPDVPLEDITILKKEAKIENNELVFDKKEIIKQFISYFVGVLFGRYSLNKEGLILANLGNDIDEYLKKIPNSTFMPDDDNIVPILDKEYFEDDIVSRFKEFLKKVFGEKYFNENLKFVEDAVGDIRKYFNKEFYKDHIQRYKKRPIYWIVTSKNGVFKALFYMHRFRPDIFARIRNEYLLELIAKKEAKREYLDRMLESVSSKEKSKIEKEIKNLDKELKELFDFDKILQKYANQKFEIDLDDGVKVNYCKFKEILYPIKGLCK